MDIFMIVILFGLLCCFYGIIEVLRYVRFFTFTFYNDNVPVKDRLTFKEFKKFMKNK